MENSPTQDRRGRKKVEIVPRIHVIVNSGVMCQK